MPNLYCGLILINCQLARKSRRKSRNRGPTLGSLEGAIVLDSMVHSKPWSDYSENALISIKDVPDGVLKLVASYLDPVALDCMSLVSRWALQTPALCRTTRVLSLPQPDLAEQGPMTCEEIARVMGRLLGRGEGSCTQLSLASARLVAPLMMAIQQHPSLGPQLTGLDLDFEEEPEQRASYLPLFSSAVAEGLLPGLQSLRVRLYADPLLNCPMVLIRALEAGHCPRLASLTALHVHSDWLAPLAVALHSRGPACARLSALDLQLPEDLQAAGEHVGLYFHPTDPPMLRYLLQAPCLARLKRLNLELRGRGAAVADYLQQGGPRGLEELSIDCYMETADGAWENGDAFALALSEGLAPGLQLLKLRAMCVSSSALGVLSQSLVERRVLSHLVELSLEDVFASHHDASTVLHAVATSCRNLQTLALRETDPCTCLCGALSVAMTHCATAFGRLRNLTLHTCVQSHDMDQLGLAVASHPVALRALRHLWLIGDVVDQDPRAISSLGLVLSHSTHLRGLHLELMSEANGACGMADLAQHMAPGGVAYEAMCRLKEIDMSSGDALGMATLLHCLLLGACPNLEHLLLSGDDEAEGENVRWPMQDAVVGLMTGQAPCSATLRCLCLSLECVLDPAHTLLLAQSISQPNAAQLECLKDLCMEGELPLCMLVLHALAGPHCGARLTDMRLHCASLDAEGLRGMEALAAELLRGGAWPSMPEVTKAPGQVGIEITGFFEGPDEERSDALPRLIAQREQQRRRALWL